MKKGLCQRMWQIGVDEMEETHPPRNAPTGLRTGATGATTASILRVDVWKARDEREERMVDWREAARKEGVSMREYIVEVVKGVSESSLWCGGRYSAMTLEDLIECYFVVEEVEGVEGFMKGEGKMD
jgi:hypothetical protein